MSRRSGGLVSRRSVGPEVKGVEFRRFWGRQAGGVAFRRSSRPWGRRSKGPANQGAGGSPGRVLGVQRSGVWGFGILKVGPEVSGCPGVGVPSLGPWRLNVRGSKEAMGS